MHLKHGGKKRQWYLQHGWGFDSRIWYKWKSLIPDDNIIILPDRHYFNSNKEIASDSVSQDSALIVVSHSFGLHFLSEKILSRADILVIIGGFEYFHPLDKRLEKRSRLIIEKMIQHLDKDPESLLSEFYANCGYPAENSLKVPDEIKNLALLKEDLQLLNEHKLDLSRLKKLKKILILNGDSDRIVKVEKAKSLHEKLKNSQLIIKENSGHLLLYTEPEWCLNQIKNL